MTFISKLEEAVEILYRSQRFPHFLLQEKPYWVTTQFNLWSKTKCSDGSFHLKATFKRKKSVSMTNVTRTWASSYGMGAVYGGRAALEEILEEVIERTLFQNLKWSRPSSRPHQKSKIQIQKWSLCKLKIWSCHIRTVHIWLSKAYLYEIGNVR